MPEQDRAPSRSDATTTPSAAPPADERDRTEPVRNGNGNGSRTAHGRRAYDFDPRTTSSSEPDQSSERDRGSTRVRQDDDDRPAHAGVGPASAVGRSSSWGPVLSGAAIAFVVFLIFTALWLGMASSGVDAVGDNLAWFQLVSGILAAAAGGAAAGWLDPRGTMTGMTQGLATWGLLVLAVTVTGIAAGTALLGQLANVSLQADAQATDATTLLAPFETELWALFAILIGGAMIAGLAGAMTGRTHTMMALDHDDTPRR